MYSLRIYATKPFGSVSRIMRIMKDNTGNAASTETRRLAAIMFTDIVGFSRQMGTNETHTLRLLAIHNQLIQRAVAGHHGTVIKTVGDAFLVDFPSVVQAVQCARQIQVQFQTHNTDKEPTDQLHVRIGIHLGDIVQKDGDVFGDGVNIASRLQGLAEPDSICLSDMVYRDVAKKLDLGTVVSLGRPKLKNIAERFQIYALLLQPPAGVRQTLRIQWLKLKQKRRTLQVVAVVMLLLLGAGAITLRNRYFSLLPALPLPDKPSIVVLPFTNMSGDSEQEYFSDGISEDFTSDLSKISGLFVIARNSAFTYKGKATKVQEVSRELGVRYVLEGSVRKADSQVRITAQLIDATTGGHLWSERYDRPLTDIFALQDEIVQKVVGDLRVKVEEAESERVRHIPTENLTAYDAFLRGMEYGRRFTKENNAQGRQMFEKATALDPNYASAYAGLSVTYLFDFILQWDQTPQTLGRAFTLAQQAVALDDSLAMAHSVLGWVYLWQKQHEQAIAEAERAVALEPNSYVSHFVLGEILNLSGRPEEAIQSIEYAIRLNPRTSGDLLDNLGAAYNATGRTEEALTILKKALSYNPNLFITHMTLALVYIRLGREEEAQAEAAEVLRLNPKFSLEAWRQNLPVKDPTRLEGILAALRKAGLK
jgi:adenylate cyclase